MALAATWVKDSPFGLAFGLHLKVTGLVSGLNTVNPQTLITDNSIFSYASPITWSAAFAFSSYDGSHTVASKVMVDQTTLSSTNIGLYCDVTGSTTADLFIF